MRMTHFISLKKIVQSLKHILRGIVHIGFF